MHDEYSAQVLTCIDGDTVVCSVGLGFGVHFSGHFRLQNLNAPETRGPSRAEGLKTKARLKELVEGKAVTLRCRNGQDKYGRWLAKVYLPGEPESVNNLLVREGLAVPYLVIHDEEDKGV